MGQCEDTQTAQSAHMDCHAQPSPSQVSSADLLEESPHCLMHLQDTGGTIFEESSMPYYALENLTALASGQDKVPSRRTSLHAERSEGKAKLGTPSAKHSIDSHSSRSSNGPESTINDEEAQRRLACPFFKHNPSKHVTERTCTGPGWSSVHRLKQHLFRRHMLLQNKSPAACPPKSCITQRVLNSLPSQTQVDPAVSRRKDAPRKLEPDMKKEIERLCDEEHTRATRAIVIDVLRYVQGRKIEISERQQETTSESSHLQANFYTHGDMLYLPTEEDMEGIFDVNMR
ncbi:putative C2H2-type domain-containing protein [Seiridium cardinale]|uniref:C2H2-type domain-containing protein n=1 Tax=Seiridium cardinale TaxID=138064 RepID=A0ABR2XAI3_9PEZI